LKILTINGENIDVILAIVLFFASYSTTLERWNCAVKHVHYVDR